MEQALCGCFGPVVEGEEYQYVPLLNTEAKCSIRAATSRTTLIQTFQNPHKDKSLEELRYVFPLYDGVAVVAFKLTVCDRVIRGIVKEKEEAKKAYEDAKTSGCNAALFSRSMLSGDVFTTKVGNVPPGQHVQVEIEYISELKHDAEVDGLRFTIPTHIAPRYGGNIFKGSNVDHVGGFTATVDAEMPQGSAITYIQSPSHPISVQIGSLSNEVGTEPASGKASATLALERVNLDRDFVLLMGTNNLGEPSAVLETHSTLSKQKVIMTTLLPAFDLGAEKPEVVFICDRSGSMCEGNRMEKLKDALQIFLKSLPIGIRFNICQFHHAHNFLWEESRIYSQESLDEAVAFTSELHGDGATNIYDPLRDTFARRHKDMNLEVFLLTDGQVYNQQEILSNVKEAVLESHGNIRVFTLGIGTGVSLSLVEGVARAGNGFAQHVSDNEKMTNKVIRMLKAALTPHIHGHSLEIKYDDTMEAIESSFEIVQSPLNSPSRSKTTAMPVSSHDSNLLQRPVNEEIEQNAVISHKYDHLPDIETPQYLQTPYNIPPPYPFNRTVVYVILSNEAANRIPRSVVLRASAPKGPLEIEIPVQELQGKGQTAHQLAAQKMVQELENGRGWIYDVKCQGNGQPLNKDYLPEIVEREAVKIGLQYQIPGKWCSFIAIDAQGTVPSDVYHNANAEEAAFVFDDPNSDLIDYSDEEEDCDEAFGLMDGELDLPTHLSMSVDQADSRSAEQAANRQGLPTADLVKRRGWPHPRLESTPSPAGIEKELRTISMLQSFVGSWTWDAGLWSTLGMEPGAIEQAVQASGHCTREKRDVISTICVHEYLQHTLSAQQKDGWSMVMEKALAWASEQIGIESALGLRQIVSRFFE